MKHAHIIHNPTAGHSALSKQELVSLIESNGYEYSYFSSKEDKWNEYEENVDFIVVAGGDGTVRKVAKELLQRTRLQKNWPIAVLPLGTANNFAGTLGLGFDFKKIVSSWRDAQLLHLDVGKVTNVADRSFFIESLGYGVFPYLMSELQKRKKGEKETPKDKTTRALQLLQHMTKEYKPRKCKVLVDGIDHSGDYLLVEVMNIRSIGPNLQLSCDSNPGDGEFEVILIDENQRNEFSSYVGAKLNGEEIHCMFKTLKAKQVELKWEKDLIHVDDKPFEIGTEIQVKIDMNQGALSFLVPK